MTQDLENIITAKSIVISDEFNKAMQKKVTKKMLPSWNSEQLEVIEKEIDESVDNPPEPVNYEPFPVDDEEESEEKGNLQKPLFSIQGKK